MQTRELCRGRGEFVAVPPAEESTRRCPLPADLLLEIVARSDVATLVRCASTCKPLRRDIRRPAFIRRVCHDGPDAMAPPRLLGFLCLGHESIKGVPPMHPASFFLAHPATPAAASLTETRLARSLCRSAVADADRLSGYEPLWSRDGLVLLRRTGWNGKPRTRRLDMCVYDPMARKCTFVPGAEDLRDQHHDRYYKHALLTPADGISGCSFLLVAADFLEFVKGVSHAVKVRTWLSSEGAWSAATFAINARPSRYAVQVPRDIAVIGGGGFIHWLMHDIYMQDCHIFTYNVLTATAGAIELPAEIQVIGRLHLASSPTTIVHGRLSLLMEDDLNISVWLLSGDGSSWTRHASVAHQLPLYSRYWSDRIATVVCGARSGTVVLLPFAYWPVVSDVAPQGPIVLDLATKEMYTVNKEKPAFLYEIDMVSRLSSMKNF